MCVGLISIVHGQHRRPKQNRLISTAVSSMNMTYEEVFFLTGYPIKFSGKATVTEKENKGLLTSTYKVYINESGGR